MVFEKIRDIIVDQLEVDEAEVTLDAMILEDLGADSIDVVDLIMSIEDEFEIEVPDEDVVNRMSGRRACVACGATYHIVHSPTKEEGICDRCGKELIVREDDKPETVTKRLNVYHEQTQPLIDYYTKQGALKEVDGTMNMDDVFNAIVEILG